MNGSAYPPSTSNLVPYVGSSQDVILGNFNLSANTVAPQVLAIKDVSLVGSELKPNYARRLKTLTFPSGSQAIDVVRFNPNNQTSGTYIVHCNTGEGNVGDALLGWQAELPSALSLYAGSITGGTWITTINLGYFVLQYVYNGHASQGDGFVVFEKVVVDP